MGTGDFRVSTRCHGKSTACKSASVKHLTFLYGLAGAGAGSILGSPGGMFYTPVTGFTALHKAAQRGDEEDVVALLAEVAAAHKPGQGGQLASWPGAAVSGARFGCRRKILPS
jgi:hypothetical protein